MSATGDVYLYGAPPSVGFLFPTPTVTIGDDSSWATSYIEKIDSSANMIFTVAVHGAYLIQLAFDSASDVYVAGASAGGLTTTPGAYLPSPLADRTLFVCKLRGSNGSVVYCTYLNAIGNPAGIVIDSGGNAIVVAAGVDGASATPGAVNRGDQIYVAKLNASGSALVYGAKFGPRYSANPTAVAVDASGDIVITGITSSADFPVTPNAVVPVVQTGTRDFASFVTVLKATGSALSYSTYGKSGEWPVSVALSPAGEVEVAIRDAASQILVRRYNHDGSALVFETSPGIRSDSFALIAVDSAGITSLVSTTDSIDIPAVQPTASCAVGASSAHLVRLDPAGGVIQSSYLDLPSPGFTGISVGLTSATVLAWTMFENWEHGQQALSSYELRLVKLTAQPGSTVMLSCVGNGATFRNAALAPGEIISVFGSGIGPVSPVWPQPGVDQRFPTQLANAELTFDGVPAPLLYVSNTQINAVTPFHLSTTTVTQMCIHYAGKTSNCMPIQAIAAAPGLFRTPGTNSAAAVNQDGTVNGPENRAPRGSIVSLFATGLGSVTPEMTDGAIARFPLPVQDLPIYVMVPSEFQAISVWGNVLYAGPAPFEIGGVSQVNVQVPAAGGSFGLTVLLPDGRTVYDYASIWTQ
jgi:uncharacterized protein (TIGR03437 family)